MKKEFNVTVDGISVRTHTGDYVTPKTNTVHATGFYGEDIEFIVPSNEAGFFS